MEAKPGRDLMFLQELLAPPCLDPKLPPEGRRPSQKDPRPRTRVTPHGRSLWASRRDSDSTGPFLQETEQGLTRSCSGPAPQSLGSCYALMAVGTWGPRNMIRTSKNEQEDYNLEPLGAAPASSQGRRRKQQNPHMGAEKVDPKFKGVTLEFQLQLDSSLRILPTYSLPRNSFTRGSPTSPVRVPEPSPRSSQLSGPRRCASCRTQRTPLWRDAEDGTPLCNACGIRYKKYGTRCSSCWLVPRKSVQPKRQCGRCGMSLDSHNSRSQEV